MHGLQLSSPHKEGGQHETQGALQHSRAGGGAVWGSVSMRIPGWWAVHVLQAVHVVQTAGGHWQSHWGTAGAAAVPVAWCLGCLTPLLPAQQWCPRTSKDHTTAVHLSESLAAAAAASRCPLVPRQTSATACRSSQWAAATTCWLLGCWDTNFWHTSGRQCAQQSRRSGRAQGRGAPN
jgi:hypothetical protein